MEENLAKQAQVMEVIDREAAAYKQAFGYNEWRAACEVRASGRSVEVTSPRTMFSKQRSISMPCCLTAATLCLTIAPPAMARMFFWACPCCFSLLAGWCLQLDSGVGHTYKQFRSTKRLTNRKLLVVAEVLGEGSESLYPPHNFQSVV